MEGHLEGGHGDCWWCGYASLRDTYGESASRDLTFILSDTVDTYFCHTNINTANLKKDTLLGTST